MKRKNIVRKLLEVDETQSTNDDLKKMIYGSTEPCFAVITAFRQTGGRGRLGRSFLSPDGGLYFSASYPLDKNTKNIPFLTLAAGLAAAEAIEKIPTSTKIDCELKWPNDIYLNGRKVCGILTELVGAAETLTAVVGIGINVRDISEECPHELRRKITSLNGEGIFPDREALLRSIVEELDNFVYLQGTLDSVSDGIVEEINRRSYLCGKTIEFSDNGRKIKGSAGEIKKDGALSVFTNEGEFHIKFGEVTTVTG